MDNRKESQQQWGPKDYWHAGPVYIRKQLALLLLIAGSAAALLLFGLPFPAPDHAGQDIPAYRYNDPALAGITGIVRVLDASGRVRYTGQVAAGAYTGR